MKHFRLPILLAIVLSISLIFAACDNANKNGGTTEAPSQDNNKHTHVFSDATCTAPKTCECGATEGNPQGHSYETAVTSPTCTESGHTTYTCHCGDTYTDSVIDALGHTYENGVCKACGEADPDYKASHTHSYNSVVTPPTCTAPGYTTHTCTCGESYTDNAIDAIGHKYEDGICSACGETDPDYGASHTHVYSPVVTSPTCTKDGYTTYTCDCGDSYMDDEIAALGHDYKDGACTICGESDPDQKPSHAHIYIPVVTAPTCTEEGYTTYTCDCGDSYKDDEIPALGHDYEDGACGICGESDPDYIPPHAHIYNPVVTAPTCTKDGYTTYTCDCGDSYRDDEIAALGHDYKNGVCGACGEIDPNYQAPIVSTDRADFNTITTDQSSGGDASYTKTFTTTNGWTTENCAIQVGGSTIINPAYPVIGPDNTHKAVCLNGKTSAPGKLTSPTLSGGIFELKLSYTKIFTDTKLSVTVTITELSTGKTYKKTIERTAEKNDKYIVWTLDWVLETPVVGDFTIEVVNNCPSGIDGNKDRFTILGLEWSTQTNGEGIASCPHLDTALITVNATCTENGSIKHICKYCGKTVSSVILPSTGHTKANALGKCDICGETLSSDASET